MKKNKIHYLTHIIESKDKNRQEAVDNDGFSYAAHLLIKEKLSASETIDALISTGLDEKSATIVVENVEKEIKLTKKHLARYHMFIGALLFFGGLAFSTGEHLGDIYWGLIVYGTIRFFIGVSMIEANWN